MVRMYRWRYILFTKKNKAENGWTNVQWVPVGKLNFVREITLCQNGSRYKTPKGRNTQHTSRSWRIACQRPSLTSQISSVVQELPFQWTQFGATDIQLRPSRSLPKDEFQQNISKLANMQCVPLVTESGISLIFLTIRNIMQINLNRSTFVVWEMKRNVSVVCVHEEPVHSEKIGLWCGSPGGT